MMLLFVWEFQNLFFVTTNFSIAFAFSTFLIQHTGSVYAEGPPANVCSQPAGPNLRKKSASCQVLASRVLKKTTHPHLHTTIHFDIYEIITLHTNIYTMHSCHHVTPIIAHSLLGLLEVVSKLNEKSIYFNDHLNNQFL